MDRWRPPRFIAKKVFVDFITKLNLLVDIAGYARIVEVAEVDGSDIEYADAVVTGFAASLAKLALGVAASFFEHAHNHVKTMSRETTNARHIADYEAESAEGRDEGPPVPRL